MLGGPIPTFWLDARIGAMDKMSANEKMRFRVILRSNVRVLPPPKVVGCDALLCGN